MPASAAAPAGPRSLQALTLTVPNPSQLTGQPSPGRLKNGLAIPRDRSSGPETHQTPRHIRHEVRAACRRSARLHAPRRTSFWPAASATPAHPAAPVTTIAGHPDRSTRDAADRFDPGATFHIDARTGPELSGELSGKLSGKLTIAPDGYVTLPHLSAVMAVNRSAPDLQVMLEQTDARELIDPSLSVTPTGSGSQKIFGGGEAESPGAFDRPGEIRALQAVQLAGGLAEKRLDENGWKEAGGRKAAS